MKYTLTLAKCRHTRVKFKLVAWAEHCNGAHRQGFITRLCCADCGCVIKKKEV